MLKASLFVSVNMVAIEASFKTNTQLSVSDYFHLL